LSLVSPRALQMADRVANATALLGAESESVSYVLRAYAGAMERREGSGLPEDDPDFLRPGRTVLILVEDVRENDPRVLAVGALAESRRDELRLEPDEVARLLASGGDPAEELEWWRALPALGWKGVPSEGQADEWSYDERLLEDLVIAPPPVQRIALAEGLDQIRHAHLWSSPADRQRAAAIARRVLHPLATRVDETLARRYGWWLRRVGPALERTAPDSPRVGSS